jgi:deoxyribodipyrimidine photo-lyase
MTPHRVAMNSRIPALRVHAANAAPLHTDGDFVLYWMIAARRTHANFALERAIEHARVLGKPLVVFEPLRVGYRWASDRLHRFVIDGMADHAPRFAAAGITYLPYVEPREGAGSGLLAALAERACVVVTDEYPCFFLPAMVAAAARRCPVRLEQIDGNGLLPLRAAQRGYDRAFDFRRHLQKTLVPHLAEAPLPDPLASLRTAPLARLAALPAAVATFPSPVEALLVGDVAAMAALPIDHAVAPVPYRGGEVAGRMRVKEFVARRLARYTERNHPDADAASGLSPYLHFGHVSAHEVFAALSDAEDWSPERVSARVTAQARGFWGMSEAAEAFFDELVTWREVSLNTAFFRADYDRYEGLPGWARATLEAHANDPRPYTYALPALEAAHTHDPIWNAAQRELVREGRIHNDLRMLWGKKILEWSATPREAFDTLVHLNNKYAVDGRDPSSYAGIAWVLGRYDRPWPERAIYGVVRTMSSDSTRKKVTLDRYLARFR